jgi:hypothetical protein
MVFAKAEEPWQVYQLCVICFLRTSPSWVKGKKLRRMFVAFVDQ